MDPLVRDEHYTLKLEKLLHYISIVSHLHEPEVVSRQIFWFTGSEHFTKFKFALETGKQIRLMGFQTQYRDGYIVNYKHELMFLT